VLADRLRITGGEAGRRIADAEMLGRRAAMTGEPLAPLWSATAAGQRAGVINADHVREIRRFFAQLPCWVDESTRERAEEKLAEEAAKVRPDELRMLADSISGYLTPEARAGLDAVLSKWAAPGMCDPADESPTVDGRPSEQAITADSRSPAQRNHDALNAGCGKWHR
jgi:Domain of unknown function (DUF222)